MVLPPSLPPMLIADDDPDIRETLRLLLEDAGYPIAAECGDGLTCLDMLRASPVPLLALLDYRMPYLDGVGVLRAVAADTTLAAWHTFVLLTASPGPAAARAAEGLPGWPEVPIVSKPFDIGTLLTVVAEVAQRLRVDDDTASE